MAKQNASVMDSREAARLLEARHADVIKSIETQLIKVGYTDSPYAYKNEQNGQDYKYYLLPYRETMILASGYSIELRSKIIDRWIELEQANRPTQLTGPQLMAMALIEADATIKKQALQIEEMKPAVQFYKDVTGSKEAISIGEAAKIIDQGMGQNTLFEFLRNNEILMKDNIPYQKYIDKEWFRVVEQKYTAPKGEVKINIKTLVYQKGIDGIIKLIRGSK